MQKFIRKCLLAFAIVCSLITNAQTIDTTTIEGLYQYIFSNLDKSQISTHYLEEYGAPVLSMGKYNGILTDSNKVDINIWRALYWQIASAYVGTGTNSFPSIKTVNTTIKPTMNEANGIAIPLLLAKYNSVISTAFSSNLLQVTNKQVRDVPNRVQSPYKQNALFAAAPTRAYTNNGTTSFLFSSDLIYSNNSAKITSIFIDCGDGTGYRSVTLDEPLAVSYADTGTKKLKIKVILSNKESRECYSNFYVAKAAMSLKTSHITARYDGNYYNFSQSFSNPNYYDGGSATVRCSVKGSERTITKPLIVVEGYDLSSVAPNIQAYDYNYTDFVNAITNEPYPGFDFNGHLDDIAGYDLIFVNFNNGTDDIKRNAALLKDVIKWVNTEKAANSSTEQNVIMGMSMGGLIARYALADMTKSGLTTSTRLLITHDSPHRGANVPLSLQYLVQMAGSARLFGYGIRDIFPQYDEAINLLNRPASQQLLLYRSTGPTTFANNTFLDGEYRNMITFGSTGPQPTYSFIATSQGSECAHPLFPAYQQLVNVDADAYAFLFPLLSYRFRTQVKAYALPNTGSSSLIASLLLKSKFKLFGLITISKQIYNNSAYAPGSQLPVDGVPGGKYDLIDATIPRVNIFAPIPGFLGILGYVYAYTSVALKQITFVPTASALDISPFNTNTFSQKFVAGNNSSYPSTGKTYIAQETISGGVSNNNHLRFTARNTEWMFDQMENISNTLNCSSECSPNFSISQTNPLCTSAVFSIPGISASSTVSWSSSPSGIVSITPNGQQATINKVSNGDVTITAIVNSCNSYSKSVHVGAPTVNIQYSINGQCNNGYQTWSLNATSTSTINSWQWTVDNPSSGSWYIYNPNSASTFVDVSGGGGISVTATSSCGTTKDGVTIYSNCPHIRALIASPNPTTDNVTIHVAEQQVVTGQNKSKAMIYQLKVTDQFGTIEKQYKFSAGITNTNISLKGLISGIYTIQAFDGISWSSVKVIKQ